MKKIIESIIRRRNPLFRWDPVLDSRTIGQFLLEQVWCSVRGCLVLLRARAPKGLLLAGGVRMVHIHKIRWGRFLRLGGGVRLSGLGREGIHLGDHVSIGAFSRVIVSTTLNDIGQFIRIGNNVGIGEFAYLGGGGGLEIGDDCIIGQYFSCHPENHVFDDPGTPIRRQGITRKGIRIGQNCWIGSRVTILDGVSIGDGCVIAAGAVVTESMPAASIIAGVPARWIRKTVPV